MKAGCDLARAAGEADEVGDGGGGDGDEGAAAEFVRRQPVAEGVVSAVLDNGCFSGAGVEFDQVADAAPDVGASLASVF